MAVYKQEDKLTLLLGGSFNNEFEAMGTKPGGVSQFHMWMPPGC